MHQVYTIHNCKPTILPEPKDRPKSSLITDDFDFINDEKPNPVNPNSLKIPGEDLSLEEGKGAKIIHKHPRKQTQEDKQAVYGKPGLSQMDKICRKKQCIHITSCAAVVAALSNAKSQKDVTDAETILELAYKGSK